VEKVSRHLDDAVSKGAEVVEGGFIESKLGPNFYVPTILMGAKSPESLLSTTEEAFGPIVHLTPFDTDQEVIDLANTEESGLASYFYTESITRIWRVSEALNTGMVGIRTGLVSACEQPFGGIKESGLGREGGRYGVEDYTNIKSTTIGL
jgi:succinate-semialdehyde dehydrogenase / glutarate-semialdehyde dehydrogenase